MAEGLITDDSKFGSRWLHFTMLKFFKNVVKFNYRLQILNLYYIYMLYLITILIYTKYILNVYYIYMLYLHTIFTY